MSWNWDESVESSGVVHQAAANTDYDDASVLQQGVPVGQPPLMDGLVGWWPLHDDSAQDLSGNGNHGTLNGGVTTGVAGRGGLEAMSFNGSDGFIDCGSGACSALAGGSFTLSVWFRTSTKSGQTLLGINPDNGDNRVILDISDDSNGKYVLHYYDGSPYYGSTSVTDGQWHHAVGVYDDSASTVDIYLDGELETSFSSTQTISSTDLFSIGQEYDGGTSSSDTSGHFEGPLADARAYSRTLSQPEIQTLYKWGSLDLARPPTDGVSRYPLDGDATDVWGSNDGIVNGGLAFSGDAIRGQSADFDGSGRYVELSDRTQKKSLSFSLWLNWGGDTTGDNQAFFSCGYDGSSTEVECYYNYTEGTVRFRTYDGSNSHGIDDSGYAPPVGSWVNLIGVYDGTYETYTLYANAVEQASVSDSYGPIDADNTEPWVIGALSSNGSIKWYTDGLIDDVRIYNYALSPSEVFQNYLWGTRGKDMRSMVVRA